MSHYGLQRGRPFNKSLGVMSSRRIKEVVTIALVWLYTGSIIMAMVTVYVGSWQWTLLATGYLVVSLAVVGFLYATTMARAPRSRGAPVNTSLDIS